MLTRVIDYTVHALGHPVAIFASVALIIGWAVCGPFFDFSETWQLVINTSTTIITFWMVFVIQHSQNRDGAAIQAKLDELIRVTDARNDLIGIDHRSQKDVEKARDDIRP